jgi:dTMP kinase
MNNQNPKKRGLLIVLEGMDRTGKSTQCKLLKEYLINIKNENVELINFPGIYYLIIFKLDRNTASGKQLNEMLKAITKMNLRASHLLFSFNRWEKKDDIINILNSGTNLIIDRYAFSGYCYSVTNVKNKNFII